MTGITQIAYAEAYEIKASHGGEFRGVAKNKLTGEIFRSAAFDTLSAARYAVENHVVNVWITGDRDYSRGTYRNPRNSWKCNFFIRADEAAERVKDSIYG